MIIATIYGLVTLALIIAFVLLVVWAYTPSRYQRLQQEANIPLLHDINLHASTQGK